MSESIERTLGRIEEKLDGLVLSHGETKTSLLLLDGRTTKLERWQSRILGGAVTAGFILGLVARALHV